MIILFLCNEILHFINSNPNKNIAIFVDMDGVIADYRFGEGEKIKNNIPGIYLNKRPIYATINNLQNISKTCNIDLYILSSCLYPEQVDEKNQWLDQYAPFFASENRYYVLPRDFDGRKNMKVDKLISIMVQKKIDIAILIEDTHEILFEAITKLKNKVLPFHVSTLID